MPEPKKCAELSSARLRRQQILDAAEKCFAEHGFHGASIAQISEAAKMSTGHIYHYFANKEKIIVAIVEQRAEALFSQSCDSLTAHIEQHCQNADDTRGLALMFDIFAESLRNPEIASLLARVDKMAEAHLNRLYREALGDLPEEASSNVDILRMLLLGFSARRACSPSFNSAGALRAIQDFAVTMCVSRRPKDLSTDNT